MSTVLLCDKRSQLFERYLAAVEKFTEAGKALANCAISYEADAYNRAFARSRDAWDETWRCRHALQEHTAVHGC